MSMPLVHLSISHRMLPEWVEDVFRLATLVSA
jgi:hypothetical protein